MIYFIVDKFTFAGSRTPIEEIEQLCTHDADCAYLTAKARWVSRCRDHQTRTLEYYLAEADDNPFDPRPMCQRWIIIKRWK